MPDAVTRLSAALADRYRIERELGQGALDGRRGVVTEVDSHFDAWLIKNLAELLPK